MGFLDSSISDMQAALDEVVNRAIVGGQGLITQAAQDFEAAATRLIDHAFAGANGLIASLDGVGLTGLSPRLTMPTATLQSGGRTEANGLLGQLNAAREQQKGKQ